MLGNLAIYAAFIFSILGALFYLGSLIFNRKGFLPYARYSHYIKTFSLFAASIYLLYALVTHKFQYYYVYAHTSTDLPLEYLISAFWAGQEGTFLLWALLAAFLGLAIIKWEDFYEEPVMIFLLAGQIFLVFFMVVYSPFRLMEGVPVEGFGLNPLLKDPWMVIHPPIIFVGYAALLLPYAFALGGLWKRDYQGWAARALPWTVFGWLFLGAGIIIGGYWAYKVLGWGGYWGWDPVENASLVPWLTCTALLHGIIVQKARGVNARSNIFFAIITYVLIIYATFITRSGILSDFSVHSFTEIGLTPYIMAFMLFFLVVGMVLFLVRFREIPAPSLDEEWYSKVSTFSYTVLLLSFSSIMIILGTSSPILTGIWGEPATVDPSFYNVSNAPLVVLLALVLAVCPLVKWKGEGPDNKELVNNIKITFAFAVTGLVIALVMGVYSPLKLVFIGSSLLALASNGILFIKTLRRGIKNTGGFLAHVGLALMFIGILTSSTLDSSEIVSFKKGESSQALGYTFTYEGTREVDDRDIKEVLVEREGQTDRAFPQMYYAGSEPRLMREPYIIRSFTRDLYISPLEEREEKPGLTFTLSRGERTRARGFNILFKDFYMESHDEAGMIEVGAVLEVERNQEKVELVPSIKTREEDREFIPAQLPEDEGLVYLEIVDADSEMVQLRVVEKDSPPPEEIFIMEVSSKPLVSVLYIGSLLLMGGALIATWKRFSIYLN